MSLVRCPICDADPHTLEIENAALKQEVERLRNLQDEDPTCCEENARLRQEVQVLTDEQGQLVIENERLHSLIEKKNAALDMMIEWALLNDDSHFGEPIPEDQLNEKFKADLKIAREARSLS